MGNVNPEISRDVTDCGTFRNASGNHKIRYAFLLWHSEALLLLKNA